MNLATATLVASSSSQPHYAVILVALMAACSGAAITLAILAGGTAREKVKLTAFTLAICAILVGIVVTAGVGLERGENERQAAQSEQATSDHGRDR